MSKKLTEKTIDEATDLLPSVIAELIAEDTIRETFKTEIGNWKNLSIEGMAELNATTKNEQNELEKYLILRANTTFQHNDGFHNKVKTGSNASRDYLYMFMYHWAGWHNGKITEIGSYKKSMLNYYRDMKSFNELQKQQHGT